MGKGALQYGFVIGESECKCHYYSCTPSSSSFPEVTMLQKSQELI